MRNRKEIEKFNAIISTQEGERNRIAADMHDELSPILAGVKLHINALSNNQEETIFKKNLNEISGHLDTVIVNLRHLSKNLSSATLDQKGMLNSIQDFQMLIQRTSSILFEFTYQFEESKLSKLAQTSIFRIIQELINNSLRHSECGLIKLDISMQKNVLKITYSDDGKNNKVISTEGAGLRNIRNRIELLHGKSDFNTDFSNGCKCIIYLNKKYIY